MQGRPSRSRAFHETHEAGTDAAPARCGLVSRSSRAAPGSARDHYESLPRSWLTAGRSRPPEARRSDHRPGVAEIVPEERTTAVCGQSAGPAPENAAIGAPRGAHPSPKGARASPKRGIDGLRHAALHPPPVREGRGKTGDPGAHDKEYGRRSVGLLSPHPEEPRASAASRRMRWARSQRLDLMLRDAHLAMRSSA